MKWIHFIAPSQKAVSVPIITSRIHPLWASPCCRAAWPPSTAHHAATFMKTPSNCRTSGTTQKYEYTFSSWGDCLLLCHAIHMSHAAHMLRSMAGLLQSRLTVLDECLSFSPQEGSEAFPLASSQTTAQPWAHRHTAQRAVSWWQHTLLQIRVIFTFSNLYKCLSL